MIKTNCPVVSAWEKLLKSEMDDNIGNLMENPSNSSIIGNIYDYVDVDIWKEVSYIPTSASSKLCNHEKVKKVMLFTSHYYVCENCGEEV